MNKYINFTLWRRAGPAESDDWTIKLAIDVDGIAAQKQKTKKKFLCTLGEQQLLANQMCKHGVQWQYATFCVATHPESCHCNLPDTSATFFFSAVTQTILETYLS